MDLKCVAKSLRKQKFQKLVKETTPDIVFLDTALMKQTAIELMAIKYKENYPDMKIILITSKEMLGRKETTTLIDIGVNGYLFRKTAHKNVVDAIKAVINGNRYLNEHIVSSTFRPSSGSVQKQMPHQKPKNTLNSKKKGEMEFLPLTSREEDVLYAMLADENYTVDDIGKLLGISAKTVKNCRTKIMKKLGVKNQVSLYKYAIKHGMLSIENFLREK